MSDGRGIDPELGALSGEGAEQRGQVSEGQTIEVWQESVSTEPTYYDRPMLKEPVWRFSIPLYYYVGGAAGASLALGAAAQIPGIRDLDRLIRTCHWIGIIGCTAGGGLLIEDLGRPSRFLNMMRVFRPTSPMNMGTWLLSGTAPLAVGAGLFMRRGGWLGRISEVLGYCSGVFGVALATYTGVLVGNTAVPVWQASRRVLPVLFGASAVAGAGSLLDIVFDDAGARRIVFTFGLAGRVAELAAGKVMEHAVANVPRVAAPLHAGASGVMWKAASVLTAASVVVMLLPRQSRRTRMISGVLGTAGSLLLRFAVHHAGFASARDPRASFDGQRAGLRNGELFILPQGGDASSGKEG